MGSRIRVGNQEEGFARIEKEDEQSRRRLGRVADEDEGKDEENAN